MKLLDLTRELSIRAFLRNVHSGTHIEAPAHLLHKGKKIDQFGLDAFITDAVVLDLTRKKPGQPIDDEDLEGAEESAGLSVREGEAVILNTQPSNPTNKVARSTRNPYLSENGAQFLEFKRPVIVGTDALNLERRDASDFYAHRILMRGGILVLEGLCNIDEIGQPRFRLLALPVRLKATAAPVRAAAILEF